MERVEWECTSRATLAASTFVCRIHSTPHHTTPHHARTATRPVLPGRAVVTTALPIGHGREDSTTPPRRCCQSAAVAADRLCVRRVPHWPRPHWCAASTLHHTTPRTHGNTAISGRKRRGITPLGEPRVRTPRPCCRHDRAANRPRSCRRRHRRVGAANRPPSRRTAFAYVACLTGRVRIGVPHPLSTTPHHARTATRPSVGESGAE